MPDDLVQRVERLENLINGLLNAAQIDPDIVAALTDIIGSGLKDSSKVAASENQDVDEAGSATYSVLGPPSGFKQDADGNNFPYY